MFRDLKIKRIFFFLEDVSGWYCHSVRIAKHVSNQKAFSVDVTNTRLRIAQV